jgi:hypothetical protein
MALQQVVTFLNNNPEKLKTWLATFMSESASAYQGRANANSCVKGVKERVITSLRSALADEPDFQDVFGQAEVRQTLKVKMAALTDMDLWAKRMLKAGVNSTTAEAEAKQKYQQALEEYFSDMRDATNTAEIEASISTMLDAFDDSTTEHNGKTVTEKGAWHKMLQPLIREFEAQRQPSGAAAAAAAIS